MFLDKKIPFQFGDPRNGDFIVFDCDNLGIQYKPSIKLERTKSALFNGESRLNGDEPNKRDDTSIKLSFALQKGTIYSESFILSLFSNSPRKLFVYEPIDNGNGYKILWQYAECASMPQLTGGIDIGAEEYEEYEVNMLLANPEFYEADDTLSYFVPGQTLYKFTDPAMFQFLDTGAIELGSYEIDSFPAFSNLTTASAQYSYLTGRLPVSVLDRYFKVEDYSIYPLLTKTLSSTPLFTTSEGINLETSVQTEIYAIELESLNQNEYIQVTNLSTNSDVKITWINTTANPNKLLFISVDNLLFDPITQTKINSNYYTIDSTTKTSLYFNKYMQWYNNPYLLVQKDTDNLMLQSTTTNQIKISTLKAFI